MASLPSWVGVVVRPAELVLTRLDAGLGEVLLGLLRVVLDGLARDRLERLVVAEHARRQDRALPMIRVVPGISPAAAQTFS